MNRRHLIRTSALVATAAALPSRFAAAQEATPVAPAEQPVDTRARELVDRLSGIAPVAVLESLETAKIANDALIAAGEGAPVMPRPWSDPLDTDLEHALGGVLAVASDDPVNSPELAMLGAWIVFESPEIAFDVFAQRLEEMGNTPSMSVAGTKAWIAESDERRLAIMRVGYVLVVAGGSARTPPGVAEGMIEHLFAVTEELAR